MARQRTRGPHGRSGGMLRGTTLGVLASVALLATVASAQAGGEFSGGGEDAECPLGEEAGSMAVGQRGLDLVKVCQPFFSAPPWRQPKGKTIVSLVNSHTNATRIGWHLWEIYLRFAPGLPPGWQGVSKHPIPLDGLTNLRFPSRASGTACPRIIIFWRIKILSSIFFR